MKLPDIENTKHFECLHKSKQIVLFMLLITEIKLVNDVVNCKIVTTRWNVPKLV